MRESNIPIQAVAFDMDGLTLNTEDLFEEVGRELMRRRGRAFREDVRQGMMGLPPPQAFGVMIREEGLNETWEELQAESDEIFKHLLPSRVDVMPGFHDLVDELDRRGLRRCIATSAKTSFAIQALTIAKAIERLDFVITAEDVPRGKPYPDIYVEAASRMRVRPEQMLVLEDSSVGTRAGVSSGAFVISVPTRHTESGDFSGARHIVDSLQASEIFNVLRFGYEC